MWQKMLQVGSSGSSTQYPMEIAFVEHTGISGNTVFTSQEDGTYIFFIELTSTSHTFSYSTNGTEIRKTQVIHADSNGDSFFQIIICKLLVGQTFTFTHSANYSSIVVLKTTKTINDISYDVHIENITSTITSSDEKSIIFGFVRSASMNDVITKNYDELGYCFEKNVGDMYTRFFVSYVEYGTHTISGKSTTIYGRAYMVKMTVV